MSLARRLIPLCQRFQTARVITARSSSGHHEENVPIPHMNDLPVPEGSWQKYYDSKQTKYNAQLGVGIVLFAISVTAWWKIIVPDTYVFIPELPGHPRP